MDDFDRMVNRIGRRKALAFFGKRIAVGAIILYFAIAAYGRYHSDDRCALATNSQEGGR